MATEITTDRVNGIDLSVLAETVQAIRKDPGLGKCRFRARNKWVEGNHNCTTVTDFYGAKSEQRHKHDFEMHADEPPILAGGDNAANPVEHLLHALASCVTTSLVAHAAVKGIPIEEMESELEGDIDLNGFLGLDPDVPKGYTDIRMKFRVKTDTENLKLLKKLSQFSPVYNTLIHGARVNIDIEPK
ncbi:MAG: OsmC family protein [Acidobacteria bacterium]|nr:OsmC family protein [Acidobacteriota bacterium]